MVHFSYFVKCVDVIALSLGLIPISRAFQIFRPLQIFPFNQAFYSFLHHRNIRVESGAQLLNNLSDQNLVTKFFSLPKID